MSSNSTKSSTSHLVEANGREELIQRMLFLGQMSSTETALFHQKAAESFGVGITAIKAISVLMQEGPMTPTQLANRLHVTTGAVTNLVDRLEKKGMVYRKRHSEDRRKLVIHVEPKSFSRDPNPYKSMGEASMRLFDGYSAQELRFLIAYLEKQVDMTRQEIEKFSQHKHRKTIKE
jgi:MarR family transcriptional regulator, organic hydroperoxide resistance regulator